MRPSTISSLTLLLLGVASAQVESAPRIARLTPPSAAAVGSEAVPVISRFLAGQRFDLQATIVPDAGQAVTAVAFFVDGLPVSRGAPERIDRGLVPSLGDGTPTPAGTLVASQRGVWQERAGFHELKVVARQSDGAVAEARGIFAVDLAEGHGPRTKNVILLLGDGMGIAHRTAARIVAHGYTQGKANGLLAMDTLPHVALVRTASLTSIVTDSAPGMSNYVTGNKAANSEEGVWPDDTLDPFDNPRVEYLSEFLHRTRGTQLGLVTTADVFDATPAANAVHTGSRGAGTGIVDQYFDDRGLTGLTVLMGGGRKWFTPAGQPGSQRAARTDYVLSAALATGWGAARGSLDPGRDLVSDFRAAGFSYAASAQELAAAPGDRPLLGLFAWGNMNVAYDKIGGRRGTSPVVAEFGLTDQPMLDEMAAKALAVLEHAPQGFYLMIEGASIDKQAHAMDSDRWLLEVLEFDRAVAVAKAFAERHPETLVIVTADHETGGSSIIGSSRLDAATLAARAQSGGGSAALRDGVVGSYDEAGFPAYGILADGYPQSMDPDHKLLIGYGANGDRNEDWAAALRPLIDGQQPMAAPSPFPVFPRGYLPSPMARGVTGAFKVTGQVEGASAVHTGADVPLSAFGRGSARFFGVMDNTELFYKVASAVLAGARSRTTPAD
ncbi:MAG: alkaline phosphatase [Pseudomonadota bacterium]